MQEQTTLFDRKWGAPLVDEYLLNFSIFSPCIVYVAKRLRFQIFQPLHLFHK